MNKGITIKETEFTQRINIIGLVLFGGLSATERIILTELINYSVNNSMCLSPDISSQIWGQLSLTQSSFNTTIFRLEKKGVIVKSGKTITSHPIFNNIQELDKLIITFNRQD